MSVEPIRYDTGRAMLLAGLRRRHALATAASTIPAQWDALRALGAIPRRRGDEAYGAICGADAESLEYMCAVEVDGFEGLPESLGRMRIPEQRYAVFVHRGPTATIHATWDGILKDWLPRSGVAAANGPDFELYPAGYDPTRADSTVEIWFPVEALARPVAVRALDVPPRAKRSNYPEPFASRVEGREKRALGDVFGLSSFGVNLTRLEPGAMSALRHAHIKQDELVYVLEGHPTLRTNEGATRLAPGMCAGFKGGTGDAHHLVNETDAPVLYLEIGDRLPGDGATYPDDDLEARFENGAWKFVHKDGTPY